MIDFGDIGPRVRSAEHRNKDAEAAKARLNALPASISGWREHLTLPGLEVLAVVARKNKAEGGPCIVHRSDIANSLGITPEAAEHRLARLVEIGAVERRERIAQAPVFAVVTKPPAAPPSHHARKADRAPRAPEPIRLAAPIKDAKLKGNLLGVRNPEEPAKTNLMLGVFGASR